MLSELPERLLPWYEMNKRELPWRKDRDPYHVWLSEIMLQQTRVEAVKGYYVRFLKKYPDIRALAEADEDELLKQWEGLGYYSRARNLKKAAQIICDQYRGVFPQQHDQIIRLPGIGNYTAGAIGSICFELPTPAVDGNVLRVIARLLCIEESVSEEKTKVMVSNWLAKVYPEGKCGSFTQALMELGATVCIPNGKPKCAECPCRQNCQCADLEAWEKYPVKQKKKERKIQKMTVLLLQCGDKIALNKRKNEGILSGMWQLPNVPGELDAQEAVNLVSGWSLAPNHIERIVHKKHVFTHVEWDMIGIWIQCARPESFEWYTREEIHAKIGLPTAFRKFLEEE